MIQIPTQIPLTLRTSVGDGLTNEQIDQNVIRLRDAILGIAASLTEAGGGRVIVSAGEPDSNNRTNVLWVKDDYSGVYLWDTGDEEWRVVGDEAYYAVATGTLGNYVATLPRNQTYAQLTGRLILIKANHSNTAAAATLEITGNDDPLPIQAVEGSDIGISAIEDGELMLLACLGDHFRLINWSADAEAVPTIYLNSDGPNVYNYTVPPGFSSVELIAQADGGMAGFNQKSAPGSIFYAWGGSGGDGGSVHAILSGFTGAGPHIQIEIVGDEPNANPNYPDTPGYTKITILGEPDETGFILENGGQGRLGIMYADYNTGTAENAVEGADGRSCVEALTPDSSRITVLGNGKHPYYGAGGKSGTQRGYRTIYYSGLTADNPFAGDPEHKYDPGGAGAPLYGTPHANWLGTQGRVWIKPKA